MVSGEIFLVGTPKKDLKFVFSFHMMYRCPANIYQCHILRYSKIEMITNQPRLRCMEKGSFSALLLPRIFPHIDICLPSCDLPQPPTHPSLASPASPTTSLATLRGDWPPEGSLATKDWPPEGSLATFSGDMWPPPGSLATQLSCLLGISARLQYCWRRTAARE